MVNLGVALRYKLELAMTLHLNTCCDRILSYEADTKRSNVSMCSHKMIQKFETTGQLGILPGRGRKRSPSSSVEEMATAVVEASSQSPHGSVSVPVVSRVLDMLHSAVR
ncbi:hypothetical protein AVEN_84104-1 [Araneus ventricosus]|uniref:DUF4817 domain-containing protein n=1 Tax=Araneus ventricosus TaxID=182803 RepID=A0A4Y2J549_ARAVE|nr:hypothetical protein AVEN_84104-1 [Araneus ventricosus]